MYVTLRNPLTVPAETLLRRNVPTGTDGEPLDPAEPIGAGCEVLSRLIVDWHVYDATATGDDQPPLPLPATEDLVRRLPSEIQNKLSAEVAERRNPTPTPNTETS